MAISETDKSYAAGIFDGEGSVLIYARTGKKLKASTTTPYNQRATVTNTNKDVIDLFKEWFGGNVVEYKPKPGERRRRAWKWTALCQDAASFYRNVLPYLRIKKTQVQVALALQETIDRFKNRSHKGKWGQTALPEEEIHYRDNLHQQLLELRKPNYIQ